MQMQDRTAHEAAADLYYGQIVVIWARWFVIVAATSLIILSSSDVTTLVTTIPFVAILIAVNFFVHGRYLMGKPINQLLLTFLSFVDLVIITLLVAFWGLGRGYSSQLYVYYYPIILAFAFVFPLRRSAVFTIVAMVGYLVTCLLVNSSWIYDPIEVERFALRLIIMAAVGGLATFYWRIQRRRLQEATAHPAIEAEA